MLHFILERALLNHVRGNIQTGNKYNMTDVVMLIDAPAMDVNFLKDFAKNGPLAKDYLGQGPIKTVVVKTESGYLTINHGSVTDGLPQGWKK